MLTLAIEIKDFLTPPVLFVAGIGVLTWTVLRMRKRSQGTVFKPVTGAASTPAPTPERTLRSSDVQQMAAELNNLLVELHETSRQIAAQIENRYAKLDALIALADDRIRKLEQLEGRTENPTPPPAQSPVAPAKNYGTPPPPTTDPAHAAVYELADQGKSAREIAQQLGRITGEIELILNLRPKQIA